MAGLVFILVSSSSRLIKVRWMTSVEYEKNMLINPGSNTSPMLNGKEDLNSNFTTIKIFFTFKSKLCMCVGRSSV